jgi:translation initiation factor 5B
LKFSSDELARIQQRFIDEPRDCKNQSGPSENLRSSICCILGHVDTGKTKLLDKLRNTSVQANEVGGITQQIGATYFPYEKLTEEVVKCADFYPVHVDIPGLLIIDTPGHESFSNLRLRGHNLCDFAILVIDIMHGIENTTLESIKLLRESKTPFVIALNKIDRLYGWNPRASESCYLAIKKQQDTVRSLFAAKAKEIQTQLNENGFNVALYYENDEPYNWNPEISEPYISIIPTSAISGEGIPDMLSCIANLSQRIQADKIKRRDDEFKCKVMEVKTLQGIGSTVDVMLINGYLREGDKIMVAGYDGVITTTIRALLTPHPMKEMRVKNEYIHHKEIRGAMGVKILANGLDGALSGSELFVLKNPSDEPVYRDLLCGEIDQIRKKFNIVSDGIFVVSSTVGSLEAILQLLSDKKIPVSGISIGPVTKTDVLRAMKPLIAREGDRIKKEYASILAFEVKVFSEAQALANQEGVRIFQADHVYHLINKYEAYTNAIFEERKAVEGKKAIFPCVLKTVAFIRKKDPLIIGVDVVEGILKVGTPLCAVQEGKTIRLGVVDSIQKDSKPLSEAKPKDGSVAICVKGVEYINAGRHFELKDKIVSEISRESIDALKTYYRNEMSKEDWDLVRSLKSLFNVI